MTPPGSPRLLLGPVLRHVGTTTASVWVQTDRPATVRVLDSHARTFEVAGHHYALVDIDGLSPASATPYTVSLDGQHCWPLPDAKQPASVIHTRGGGDPLRVVFGSCRYPKPDEPKRVRALGSDALDAYAAELSADPASRPPDALLLLGDQVYADNPTPQVRRWLATRRDVRRPPWQEVADFAEYARLYTESWQDSELRWLLSTTPTAMIFDDHDVRDDWNTSQAWLANIRRQSWWETRLRAALVSYWIYQHIGNLAPDERAADPTWTRVREATGDTWPILAEAADLAASNPYAVRWSFRWDLDRTRLIMVDTRAARVLTEGHRSMLDETEFAWLERSAGEDLADVDHVLVGSSLPWLLPPAIDHAQAANERYCGSRNRLVAGLAERARQLADLEHWAAFQRSFARFTALLRDIATDPDAPATVSVLSGDVHHSYAVRAEFPGVVPDASVYQLVCSPIHQALPGPFRAVLRIGWSRPAITLTRWLRRLARAPLPEVSWTRLRGPYFHNAVATVHIAGRAAELAVSKPDGLTCGQVTRLSLGETREAELAD
ncbi:PhoD-like phosphatase [Tamaricihabitans halophyticus]|uniref:PhoD-like phosphatase n=1 Tax=Tamaricihabitans halophyticus TaxID=1262583 RepID=A0A4V2SR83_9PSEU|nr:alkaline phosphatase D family protein [Tamaricihabitans halophyticus]TCP41626.1 PhoD-like phosphatase [Tamaricihabitans halophyticus]